MAKTGLSSKFYKMIKIMMILSFIASIILGCRHINSNNEKIKAPVSIYNLSFVSLTGETIKMSSFKGKKIIIVNVASRCGFTPQYGELEKMQQKFKDKIQIIGFPCNQFGMQEPGNSTEIKEFCTSNYGVTFPISEKVKVKGNNKSPIYEWLSNKKLNGWNSTVPSWNFCKYIVSEEGDLVGFFSSKVLPDDKEIEKYLN
jgi:glutathione peroxidase